MKKEELKAYLQHEERHTFSGWDFSYLKGRWENENLPWNYQKIVSSYLKDSMELLDMGTGGGEFILTLGHPFEKTAVTESYPPNIRLCQEILSPKGITVYPIPDTGELKSVPDHAFDMVINRHESFKESEVARVIQQSGMFITQQVGAYNNKDLATFFDPNHRDGFPWMTLSQTVDRLKNNGFHIIYQEEYYPKIRFYDLGAIAYFAKIIPWEFTDFSVERHMDKFMRLQDKLEKKGYIESTEHRFIIVAKKNENR